MPEPYAEMERIALDIIKEWKERGQVNYGDAFRELGSKGQFSDIWRKIKKLKRSVWEGQLLVGEQAEQIAAEIIPHCLMMIYLLRLEAGPTIVQYSPAAGYVVARDHVIGQAQDNIRAGDVLDIDLETGKVRAIRV